MPFELSTKIGIVIFHTRKIPVNSKKIEKKIEIIFVGFELYRST